MKLQFNAKLKTSLKISLGDEFQTLRNDLETIFDIIFFYRSSSFRLTNLL